MSLLSELIVQGVRQGTSRGLSQAIGRAVGSQLGSGAYGALTAGSGGGASAAQQQAVVDKYMQPANQPPTDLSGVEVQAPANLPSLAPGVGSAVGDVIAGGAANQNLAGGETPLEGVEVQGQAPQGDQLANLGAALSSALAPNVVSSIDVTAPERTPPINLTSQQISSGIADFLQSPTLDEITIEPKKDGDFSNLLLPAGIGGAAILASLGGGGGSDTPTKGGVDVKDVLPLLPLLPLIPGLTGDGDNPLNSDAAKALTDIANNNKNLANRLANIADAGFQGNIGGKGLNTIDRMVRRAQAAIRQRYAAMGMSGSSAENADLQAAVESGVEMQFKIGQDMAKTGLTAIAALTGQSASTYAALLNAQMQRDTQLGNAQANFISALTKVFGL